MPDQQTLLEFPEQPERSRPMPQAEIPVKKKYRFINRAQVVMKSIRVDDLVAVDHKARGIWELVGSLDLSPYEDPSTRDNQGGPVWSPRALASVWLYGYSEGISSARELERFIQSEPGLKWLTGLQSIDHHTLIEFRLRNKEALDVLFMQLLMAMDGTGWFSLKGGTRAGEDLVRRDPRAEDNKEREAALQLAQLERKQRLAEAFALVQSIQAKKER